MSKLIKGPHLETVTNNSGKRHYIMSSMLFHLPEQVTYVERNASARWYMKLKLYVNGCRSTSHSTRNETLVHKYTWNLNYTSADVEVHHTRLSRQGLWKTWLGTTTPILIPSVGELLIKKRHFATWFYKRHESCWGTIEQDFTTIGA